MPGPCIAHKIGFIVQQFPIPFQNNININTTQIIMPLFYSFFFVCVSPDFLSCCFGADLNVQGKSPHVRMRRGAYSSTPMHRMNEKPFIVHAGWYLVGNCHIFTLCNESVWMNNCMDCRGKLVHKSRLRPFVKALKFLQSKVKNDIFKTWCVCV